MSWVQIDKQGLFKLNYVSKNNVSHSNPKRVTRPYDLHLQTNQGALDNLKANYANEGSEVRNFLARSYHLSKKRRVVSFCERGARNGD